MFKFLWPSKNKSQTENTESMALDNKHYVNGRQLTPPFPDNMESAVFGMGCFWGAEKSFWSVPGVYTTAVGYSGGELANPTYSEVCLGKTGHAEVVLVVFDPKVVSYNDFLKIFFESHNPTQGMRQGNDRGTQYRSCIYTSSTTQYANTEKALASYQKVLHKEGYAEITTEILGLKEFYYAESYHQQYLAKNTNGYCGLGGIGLKMPA